MKEQIASLALLVTLLISCGQNKDFVAGTWTMENLNSIDSSVNRETLLSTFIPHNYSALNLLEFTDGKTLTMKTKEGKEIGKGTYKLSNNTINITFPNDKIESEFKIMDRTDNTLKLTAYNEGEIINILLSKN